MCELTRLAGRWHIVVLYKISTTRIYGKYCIQHEKGESTTIAKTVVLPQKAQLEIVYIYLTIYFKMYTKFFKN